MVDQMAQIVTQSGMFNMIVMSLSSFVGFLGGAATVWMKLSRKSQIKSHLEIPKLAQECEGCKETLKQALWGHVYDLYGVSSQVNAELGPKKISHYDVFLIWIVLGILFGAGVTIFSSIVGVVGLVISIVEPVGSSYRLSGCWSLLGG